jgi:hypothetical protein
MDDPRTLRVSYRGKLGISSSQSVDQRSSGVTSPVMDHQTRRLVHHDDVVVLVDHAKSHV